MKKNIIIILFLFLSTIFLFWCNVNKDKNIVKDINEAKLKNLKVVIVNMEDLRVLMNLAFEKNIFKKNWLNVELMNVASWTDKLLMQNAVDVKIWSVSNALWMYFNDLDPVVIWKLFSNYTNAFVSRFPEKDIKNVKVVGIDRMWNDWQYWTLAALKNLWVDIDEVKIIAIPNDKLRFEMLKKEEIDFSSMTDFKHIYENKNNFTFFSKSATSILDWYEFSRVVLTNKRLLIEKNAELKSFMKSLYETIEYMKNNESETIEFISKSLSLTKIESETFYSQFKESLKKMEKIPKENDLKNVWTIVSAIVKPKNPSRDLKDFIYNGFVSEN